MTQKSSRLINIYRKRIFDMDSFKLFGPIIQNFKKLPINVSLRDAENDAAVFLKKPVLEFETFPIFNPWKINSSLASKYKVEDAFIPPELILPRGLETKFPSVTKILSATMPNESVEALEKWKLRMIEKLGEEGFRNYQNMLFRRGKNLHYNITLMLEKKKHLLKIDEEIEGFWCSLSKIFPSFGKIKLLEKTVYHPFLCYKGIIDCVAIYSNELFLIDWKTSSRSKPTLSYLYDEPLQAVAYVGALNFDNNYKFHVNKIAIVVAYENGQPANMHKISYNLCKAYWQRWMNRLKEYWTHNQPQK